MDDRSNDVLIKAKTVADKNNINVVLSNRCFEIWYLLHFTYTTTEFVSTEQLIKALEPYIPDYTKNKNVFDKLEQQADNRKNAIERAKKLVKYHENTKGISVYSKESNPSTDVYRLIEIIQNYILR
jgi:acid phosphatase class B